MNHKPTNKYKPIASQTKQMLKHHKQQAPKKNQAHFILYSKPYKDPPEEDWIQCSKCKKGCHENEKEQFVTFVCLEITSFCLT